MVLGRLVGWRCETYGAISKTFLDLNSEKDSSIRLWILGWWYMALDLAVEEGFI